jgi:hypothetical protein
MLPTKFRFIWKSCFRGEDCYKLTNQKQKLPVAAIQMNRNLVGSIYGMSSIKIAYFVLICLQTWPPHTILVSDWSISKKIFSETAWPNEPKLASSCL